jgi:hypothetical protein
LRRARELLRAGVARLARTDPRLSPAALEALAIWTNLAPPEKDGSSEAPAP